MSWDSLQKPFNEMTTQLARARELEAQLHEAEKGAADSPRQSLMRSATLLTTLTSRWIICVRRWHPKMLRSARPSSGLPISLAEVLRINRHITDFLKYSRPSTLDFQPVDLRTEAEDALRLIEAQAAEHGIQTGVEVEAGLPAIVADRETLRSAFTNLIINGLQAIDGDGGNILIKLSSEDSERVRVEVIDTGRGIAPEDISKVFEPYYSTKDTGTGLGLAIVRKAVEDHGGTVSVHSKQGSGTTFTIILPLQPETG